MVDNQNSYPASDINKAVPLFIQKSWSDKLVVFTPGFIGNITVNINDGVLNPVLTGYM